MGIVKLKVDPRSSPGLCAQIFPPWASTIPLQIARPRPLPESLWRPPSWTWENFLKRWGSLSWRTPLP